MLQLFPENACGPNRPHAHISRRAGQGMLLASRIRQEVQYTLISVLNLHYGLNQILRLIPH